MDEHIYQEEVIVDIQNLMETPKQELIDGRIISEGDVYDFIRWYSSVIIAKEMFESFTRESTRWKKIVDNIKQGISNAVASLLSQRLMEEEMKIDNMNLKLEEFFQLNVYERDDFENFSIFLNTMHTAKDLLLNWDEILGKVERAILVLEFKQEFAPSISTKELETVLDRFLSFGKRNQG